jgi:CRISPR-associated protein Cas1
MKKLLNTLYVITPEVHLTKCGETIEVRHNDSKLLQVPFTAIESVVCFGPVGFSPILLGALASTGISVSFLSPTGRYLASVRGAAPGNVLLRRHQFRLADDTARSLELARNFVLAKIANSRSVLVRAARESPVARSPRRIALRQAARRLRVCVPAVRRAADHDALRGCEGEAAKNYFASFDALRSPSASDDFAFARRSRRPPLDRVNALLSFVYTLLLHDCCAACESVGLDSHVGFLHDDRSGKPSLALDLMEEFRAPIADRLVLTLINRHQVKPQGFLFRDDGSVVMDDETRKTVLTAWRLRKTDELRHPVLHETIPVGLLPFAQALLLARFIRGEADHYPPYRAST